MFNFLKVSLKYHFFPQACCGTICDDGYKIKTGDTVDCRPFNALEYCTEVFIPSQADFLIAQSTCPG